MQKSLITIFLLSHNRPKLAITAIESILNQSMKNFRFIVSDNSSNTVLKKIINSRFPEIEYKSWFPGIPVGEHFKKVISLVDTPYFVMFHDDDVMQPDFVRRVLEEFKNSPKAAAIGTNAWKIDKDGERIQDKTFFVSPYKIETISSKNDLLGRYLVGDFGGVSPWSTYAYNSELIKGLSPDYLRLKNYCDTFFLMEIFDRGNIVWVNEPLAGVRVHDNNLSTHSGVNDYKLFVKQIQKQLGSTIEQLHIDEYRSLRLFFALKKNRKWPIPAIKYLTRVFLKLFVCSNSFKKRVFKKIFS